MAPGAERWHRPQSPAKQSGYDSEQGKGSRLFSRCANAKSRGASSSHHPIVTAAGQPSGTPPGAPTPIAEGYGRRWVVTWEAALAARTSSGASKAPMSRIHASCTPVEKASHSKALVAEQASYGNRGNVHRYVMAPLSSILVGKGDPLSRRDTNKVQESSLA